MNYFYAYLLIGVLNVVQAHVRSMFNGMGGFNSLAMVVIFLLIWPLQLLFFVVTRSIGWIEDHGEGWVP